jgi:predicted negative regulator of RcsB-dependent stress response
MTDNATNKIPEPKSAPSAAAPDELHELRNLIRERGLPVGIAVVLGLAVAVGITVYRSHVAASRSQAAIKLSTARTARDLENVVTQHASTPTAPLAVLKLARSYFDSGNYDGAMAKYAEFKQQHPTHPMALAADLGRAHCLEAKGQMQEALTEFSGFVAGHPKHFLEPQAVFGKARCLEALGKRDEAKAVCEDFIVSNPKSGWVPYAEEQVDRLKRPAATNEAMAPAAALPLNVQGDFGTVTGQTAVAP